MISPTPWTVKKSDVVKDSYDVKEATDQFVIATIFPTAFTHKCMVCNHTTVRDDVKDNAAVFGHAAEAHEILKGISNEGMGITEYWGSRMEKYLKKVKNFSQ